MKAKQKRQKTRLKRFSTELSYYDNHSLESRLSLSLSFTL